MAAKILCLSLSFLLAFHVCFGWEEFCNFQTLTAQEPSSRLEAEAGYTEFWDNNSQEFRCAGGTQAARRTIQPKGLLLPLYSDLAGLTYIVEGSGIWGIAFPWCAESPNTAGRFKPGDAIAFPGGFPRWLYNDGDETVTMITLNYYNAYDITYQHNGDSYYLAGSKMRDEKSGGIDNIFKGFEWELLPEGLKMEAQLLSSLQGQNDSRGNIVFASGLDDCVPSPSVEVALGLAEQPTQGRFDELLEEDWCTMKLQENVICHKATSHDYKFIGGFINTIDSETLPILKSVQISLHRGVLDQNVTMAPHTSVNAHSIVYVTKGKARVEVLDNRGVAVFNGEVEKGQILVVPRNFVTLAKASNQGIEWITFKTKDYSMRTEFSGSFSIFKAMPLQVLMNSYQISSEDAVKLQNI